MCFWAHDFNIMFTLKELNEHNPVYYFIDDFQLCSEVLSILRVHQYSYEHKYSKRSGAQYYFIHLPQPGDTNAQFPIGGVDGVQVVSSVHLSAFNINGIVKTKMHI